MAVTGQLIQFGPYYRSGVLVSTLWVYHYTTGTTSTLAVYTDRTKLVTAAQPVVSDANGIVSFYADGLYKFVIKNGADSTTLYTYDNWNVVDNAGALAGEGTAIASAAALTLGEDGNQFHITGSTGPIASLSGTQPEVTLIFDSTPTLVHSGSLILQYAADYVCAANVTVQFMNEGSGVWRELSRTPAGDFGAIDAKGDLMVGTANNTVARFAVGTAGSIPMSRTAPATGLAYVAALTKAIYGLTYDNGTDAINDLNVNTGGAMDATGAYWITLATALGKQSDAAWTVGGTTGTPLGGLDTGAVGNSDYYIWLIARSDTGVVDALYSLSSTAPTMPTNYDFKRLIGWFKRVGGTIVAMTTYETEGGGLELLWSVPTLDINLANGLGVTRRADAVKVPLNFSVLANLNVKVRDSAATAQAWIYCPDQTDAVPSATAAPLSTFAADLSEAASSANLKIRTSATGTIAARSTISTVDLYAVSTMGFTWARRN